MAYKPDYSKDLFRQVQDMIKKFDDLSSEIKEERKKTLAYNAAISTGLSILSSYVVDKLLDKPTEKFIENFKKANKGLPNVEKQVEGIRIAKPILIMAGIYYTLIPFLSAFLSEKAEHKL